MGHFWGHQFVQPQTCSGFRMPQGESWGCPFGLKNKTTSGSTQRFAWRKMQTTQQTLAQYGRTAGTFILKLMQLGGLYQPYKQRRTRGPLCFDATNIQGIFVQVGSSVLFFFQSAQTKTSSRWLSILQKIKSSKSRDVYICYICLVPKPLPTGIVSI